MQIHLKSGQTFYLIQYRPIEKTENLDCNFSAELKGPKCFRLVNYRRDPILHLILFLSGIIWKHCSNISPNSGCYFKTSSVIIKFQKFETFTFWGEIAIQYAPFPVGLYYCIGLYGKFGLLFENGAVMLHLHHFTCTLVPILSYTNETMLRQLDFGGNKLRVTLGCMIFPYYSL